MTQKAMIYIGSEEINIDAQIDKAKELLLRAYPEFNSSQSQTGREVIGALDFLKSRFAKPAPVADEGLPFQP